MCVCERACVGVGGLAGGRELTASLLWPGLPSLCQFKLFMSGQWKEYSKIKNASGSGRAWILVQWKQPWEEGLPAWCPGVGWAAGGFRWGVFSCWLGSSSVDRASAEVRPPHPRVRPGDVESSMRNQVLQSGRPGGHLQNTASLSPGHRLPCCLPPPVTPPDGLTLCSSLPPTLRWLLTRKSSILRWPPVNSNESSLIGWGTRSCPPPRAPTPPGNYI